MRIRNSEFNSKCILACLSLFFVFAYGIMAATAATFNWTVDADGNWTDTNNWDTATYPDATDAEAMFSSSTITANRTVTPDDSVTVNKADFLGNSTSHWSLVQANTSVLTLDGTNPRLNIESYGASSFNVPLVFADTTGTGLGTIRFTNDGGGQSSAVTLASGISINRDLLIDSLWSNSTISGNITGTGNVEVRLQGRDMNLTGTANNFAGDLTIRNTISTVRQVFASSLPNNVAVTVLGTGDGAAGNAVLMLTGNATISSLSGTGIIQPSSSTLTLHIADSQETDVVMPWTNGQHFKKTGSGTIQFNRQWDTRGGTGIIEAGTVIANHSQVLHQGTVTVYSGASFLIGEGITLERSHGSITFQAGSTLGGSGTYVKSGYGDFTIPANFTVAPGFSAGTLVIDVGSGNMLTLSDTNTLEIELESDSVFDVLNVTGNAELNGILEVSALEDYSPAFGQTFTILTASGTLTDLGLALAPENVSWYSFAVDGNNLVLTSLIPEPASGLLLLVGGLVALRRRRS